jgi:tetratricopeptide (TPR) repeat protein
MGLYDDAIAEFRGCLDSINRRLESLHMMGLCALDLGRTADAVNHLEQALATPELEEDRKVGVYFDLARAHEAAGDPGRAEGVYLEVKSLDASFPGIDERLEAVRGGGSGAPVELASEADGGFESFDELFSDAASDEDAEPEAE